MCQPGSVNSLARTGLVVAVIKAGVAVAYCRALRPRQLVWGATDDEVGRALPGDGILPSPDLVATRAISVNADAVEVWPWVAQLGQGRGGFYTYDRLENLVGCDIHSADAIVPEWQGVSAGDDFRLHPDIALQVAAVDPPHSLVVRGGIGPTGATSQADPDAPYDFTWAFVVESAGPGLSRLLVRERYAYRTPWAALLVEPVSVVSFVMTQRMLRGIRDRAEASSPGG